VYGLPFRFNIKGNKNSTVGTLFPTPPRNSSRSLEYVATDSEISGGEVIIFAVLLFIGDVAMRNLSRYRAPEEDKKTNPSDLQWLEDGINFMGAWTKDILFPDKRKPKMGTVVNSASSKPDKMTKRKKRRGRKVIRIYEREIEVTVDD
jgi:hypothetical protein